MKFMKYSSSKAQRLAAGTFTHEVDHVEQAVAHPPAIEEDRRQQGVERLVLCQTRAVARFLDGAATAVVLGCLQHGAQGKQREARDRERNQTRGQHTTWHTGTLP